jgi:hypothetical protein
MHRSDVLGHSYYEQTLELARQSHLGARTRETGASAWLVADDNADSSGAFIQARSSHSFDTPPTSELWRYPFGYRAAPQSNRAAPSRRLIGSVATE